MNKYERLTTIDHYIDGFVDPKAKQVLQKTRETIAKAAPGAKEAISYGIPTFDLAGTHLVHFAAFKNHLGFYPIPTAIAKFKKELAKYEQGKGSVQFPLDKPIPYALITKLVKFRVKEVSPKPKATVKAAKKK